jgi:hypothetical protein
VTPPSTLIKKSPVIAKPTVSTLGSAEFSLVSFLIFQNKNPHLLTLTILQSTMAVNMKNYFQEVTDPYSEEALEETFSPKEGCTLTVYHTLQT